MTGTQVLRLGQLDTRRDTPMREEVRSVNESSMNGNAPHGLPTPAHDVPSSGFTAVNGETSRSASFRQDEAARTSGTAFRGEKHSSAISQHTSGTPIDDQHRWRPDERNEDGSERAGRQQEASSAQKRKRTDSNGLSSREGSRDAHAYAAGPESPKRRMTLLNSGGIMPQRRSSNSRTESEEDNDLEPATAANNRRAPSPIYRAGHGTPPPPPPRESEDALAKSLQATLGPRSDDDVQPDNQDPGHDDEEYDRQQSHASDNAQQGENADPKKRKRNFSNRTKTGCHTCRSRKKKCDEGKPICENCKRGGFDCGGYGPKPPGVSKISAIRNVPLQAKHYEYGHAPGQFFEHPRQQQPPPPPPHHMPPHHHGEPLQHMAPGWEPPRPDSYPVSQPRYGPPPPMSSDHRPPPSHDPWPPRTSWPATDQSIGYSRDRLPPVDFTGVPPPSHNYAHDRQPPIDPRWPPQGQSHYRPPPAPPTIVSNHSSTSSRGRQYLPPMSGPPAVTERMKMLTGQPYKHLTDEALLHERDMCKRAVEGYNAACAASSIANGPEKERQFSMILDPGARAFSEKMGKNWSGPVGECGVRTHVEAPFSCEYGYNIKLGSEVMIFSNCLMEDACLITIGDRSIVGRNVKFYCMTTSVDATLRGGCRGNFNAGAITVEEDCVIGADSIILPFRTIGKGAVVGAGSVVTKDVKPYTVVAGNPAKQIRKRKIEPGAPHNDRHEDQIQEENDRMLEIMAKRPFSRERVL